MSEPKNKALADGIPRRVFSLLMNPNTFVLPDAVADYFDAANRFDAESAAARFTPDAAVQDEGQTHNGTEAIKRWVSHTSENYQPKTTVLDARADGDTVSVNVRVAGQFPGSPADLEFEFALRDGKIAKLSIH